MTNVSLFSQIIQHLDRHIFKKLVRQHQSDRHYRGFGSYSHLLRAPNLSKQWLW
ncbi:MAG: DUF4372 domain-containing protein [Bacteroidales bacterium]